MKDLVQTSNVVVDDDDDDLFSWCKSMGLGMRWFIYNKQTSMAWTCMNSEWFRMSESLCVSVCVCVCVTETSSLDVLPSTEDKRASIKFGYSSIATLTMIRCTRVPIGGHWQHWLASICSHSFTFIPIRWPSGNCVQQHDEPLDIEKYCLTIQNRMPIESNRIERCIFVCVCVCMWRCWCWWWWWWCNNQQSVVWPNQLAWL